MSANASSAGPILLLVALGAHADTAGPRTWSEVRDRVAAFDASTAYCDIAKALGEPYARHPTPSASDEYVLYYAVPDEPDRMYWLMLDTASGRFRYWGDARQRRFPGESERALANHGLTRDGFIGPPGPVAKSWPCR